MVGGWAALQLAPDSRRESRRGGGRLDTEGGSAPAATGVWPGGGAAREGGTGLVVALGGRKGPAGREVG